MLRYGIGGRRSRAALAVIGALAFTAAADAQDAALKEALLRNQAIVEAALYETTDGERVFVLDRTREPPLLQFRSSIEVFALTRVAASRGDEILRTDTGENLVRVTTLGAVTLYPPEHPTGLPATRLGPAEPLPALADAPLDGADAARALAAQAGEAEVEAPGWGTAAGDRDALLADAMRLTAEALRSTAEAPDGQAKLAKLTRIRFAYGADADARVEDGVLVVQLQPGGGYAGRPSSLKVSDAVLGGG